MAELNISNTGVFYFLVGVEMLLVFFSRYSYNLLTSNQTEGDAFGNFLQIRDIRKNNHRVPDSPSHSAMSGTYTYPYFVLWLLSYLPEIHLKKVDKIFSASMDLITGLVILLLAPLGILDNHGVVVALGVLIFTPQFMRPDLSHGRGFTQRKPGLLLTTGSVLLFLIWSNDGLIGSLFMSILFAALVCLTSKFSLQAMIFIYLGFTIFLYPTSILVPLTSVVLAITISKGKYFYILTGHLRHVYDYAKVRQYQRFDHKLPNPISYLVSLFTVSSRDELLNFVYSTKFTRAFLNNPYLIYVGLAYFLIVSEKIQVFDFTGMHIWILTGIVCFILISMPHLLFLGLSERYLEYIFVPSAALIGATSSIVTNYSPVLVLIFTIGGIVQIVYIWGYTRVFQDPERTTAVSDVADFLTKQEGEIVAVQPAYRAREIAWRTNKKVLEDIGGHTTSTKEARREKNKLFSEKKDDYLTSDVNWIKEVYDPDWIVFDVEKIQEMINQQDSVPGIQIPKKSPEYENSRFAVYKYESVLHCD
jgi:hypothetical protein